MGWGAGLANVPNEITIIDVMRELGIVADKHLTWKVGLEVRKAYEEEYGRIPLKKLRTKTCGEGVHCFAVYPESFRERIKEIWLKYAVPPDPDAPPPDGRLL